MNIDFNTVLVTAFSGFGVVLIGWAIKKFFRSRRERQNNVWQQGNTVAGDLAGGDITKTEIKLNSGNDKKRKTIK